MNKKQLDDEFIEAAINGDMAKVKDCIEKHPDMLSDFSYEIARTQACLNYRIEVFKYIIEAITKKEILK